MTKIVLHISGHSCELFTIDLLYLGMRRPLFVLFLVGISLFLFPNQACSQESKPRVVGFYTAQQDQAHISFVAEANQWISDMGRRYGFDYDFTKDWSQLNSKFLSNADLIIFLDTRPDSAEQRHAFEEYMKKGGAWLGFHFSGFALTPSAYPQNWDWYHNEFLGAGQYRSNTWRPVPAVLRVEDRSLPVMKSLPDTFRSAASEWYRWEKNLKHNADIRILLSIDPSSFPLGTGPKPDEIWHEGYYPVAWTNKKYRMIYMNMGHNDIDYENKTNKTLSSTFSSESQNLFILQSILWLIGKAK